MSTKDNIDDPADPAWADEPLESQTSLLTEARNFLSEEDDASDQNETTFDKWLIAAICFEVLTFIFDLAFSYNLPALRVLRLLVRAGMVLSILKYLSGKAFSVDTLNRLCNRFLMMNLKEEYSDQYLQLKSEAFGYEDRLSAIQNLSLSSMLSWNFYKHVRKEDRPKKIPKSNPSVYSQKIESFCMELVSIHNAQINEELAKGLRNLSVKWQADNQSLPYAKHLLELSDAIHGYLSRLPNSAFNAPNPGLV